MQTELSIPDLLARIREDFSDRYAFKRSSVFFWSPSNQTVHYSTAKSVQGVAVASLLHEIGHAELGHIDYRDDLELLMMEVAAWAKAKELARDYNLVIDDSHIEACMDSYRDWLSRRSQCIDCKMHAFQTSRTTYQCHNCLAKWQVPASRMCAVRKKRLTNVT